MNIGLGLGSERLPERAPGIDHDAGQPGDVPPEHAADDGGERAVRPGPPVPRGGARVLHERDAAPEPPPRLPRAPGARHARELPLLPAPLVVAPQRGVPLEQARDEPRRVLLALRLGPGAVVVVVGVAVGEELRRGAEGLSLRERAGGRRRRRRLRGGRGRGRRGLGPGFRGGIRRGWRKGPLEPGILWLVGGGVEPAALGLGGYAAGGAGLGSGGGGRAAAPEGVEVEDLLGEAAFAFAGRESGPWTGRPAAARHRRFAIAAARHCGFRLVVPLGMEFGRGDFEEAREAR